MSTQGSKRMVKGLFNDIEPNKVVEFDGCLILEEITSNLQKHLKVKGIIPTQQTVFLTQ